MVLLIVLFWILLLIGFIVSCERGTKPVKVFRYPLIEATGEKPRPRILRTALPDKRLTKNEWFKYIHKSANEPQ